MAIQYFSNPKESPIRRPLICAFSILLVAALTSCNQVGDFAGGKKKTEIGTDSGAKRPPPKPSEDERAEDPIMTSGTYLTCEEQPSDSDQELELGCDLRSRSSNNVVALESYFTSWKWSEVSHTADGQGVQINQSSGFGKHHVNFAFSGAKRSTLVSVAKTTRIIFSGVSKIGGSGNTINTEGYVNDISTELNPGSSAIVNQPLPVPTPKPPTSSPLPLPVNTPNPVPTQQPVAIPPAATPTPLPTRTPIVDPQPIDPVADPVAGPFAVTGNLVEKNGRLVLMVGFSDTKGITNLNVVSRTFTVDGNGASSMPFEAGVVLTFLKDGKKCTYMGPVGAGSQTLAANCGE